MATSCGPRRREFDAFRAALAKNSLELAKNSHELRQMSTRNERVTRAFLDELREMRIAFREETEEQRGVLRDLVAESRAQRQALLAVLDRFQNGGGPAAAGA